MAQRLTRDPEHAGVGYPIRAGAARVLPDVPFDADKHRWEIECQFEGGYTLETCFQAAEELLEADSGQMLKTAVIGELNKVQAVDSGAFTLGDYSLTLIQFGGQQAIFKVVVLVTIGDKTRKVSLVVGVSRHPILNEMVKVDHEWIAKFRQLEAESKGVKDPLSREADETATFPRHYGARETKAGPYAWVSEYCEGYFEANLFYRDSSFNFCGDNIDRFVRLNGLNQGREGKQLKIEDSDEIRSEVLKHQIRTALLAKMVMKASFRSGDYMYHPAQKRLMLHCYRRPPGVDLCDQLEVEGCERKLLIAAFQLIFSIISTETNLSPNGGEDTHRNYFIYSLQDLIKAIGDLRKDETFLNQQEWAFVTNIFSLMAQGILSGAPSEIADRALATRMRMVQLTLMDH
ncbi:MAG: hypothetical protein WC882_00440 [Candidatus Gracilibacteria bacterium]